MTVYDTPGDVTLRLSLGGGEISIESSDERRVSVEAVALRDDDVTHEALARLRIEHVSRAGRDEVVVEAPKGRGGVLGLGRGPSLGIRIRCPHGSDLDTTTSSADVGVRGSLGSVRVRTASGEIVLDAVGGRCELTTASGDTEIRVATGAVQVKTASGDCDIRRAEGPVTANVVSGDVRVEEAHDELVVNSVSGDVRVDAVHGHVRVNSVSGDVRLGVAAGLRLWIDASSVSGSMNSDLEVGEERPADESQLVEIRARTVSGDVHIGRAAAPSPAAG